MFSKACHGPTELMVVGNPRCTCLRTFHGAEEKTNAKYAPGTCWIHPAEGKQARGGSNPACVNLNQMGGPIGAAWKTHVVGEMRHEAKPCVGNS